MPKIKIDAVNISYDEAGSGENLILIHGLGFSKRLWTLQIPAFSKHYRTIAIDCRGHGDSDKPATEYDIFDMASDLCSFMDSLGLERTSVVGHSMGGMIAQAFALEHPEKVVKLVLADTRSQANPEFEARMLRHINEETPETLARNLVKEETAWPIPEEIKRMIHEDVLKIPKDVYIRNMKAIMNLSLTGRLHEIKVKTLIVVGEKDPLMGSAKILHGGIEGSEMTIIEKSGHSTPIENPEMFNRIVLSFLRRA